MSTDEPDLPQAENEVASSVRHEEELRVGTTSYEDGSVRLRKRIDEGEATDDVPRASEEADVERVAAGEGDSGGILTLPDGSVSVPLLEEELIVTKRVVVRERVIIRKHTRTEHEQIKATLRREYIDVENDMPSEDGGEP
jgi:uncharacterized protein (TIGR02271 family)